MTTIREGTVKDLKKLQQDWAWSDADWQQKALQETIKAIHNNTQSFVVIEDGEKIVGEVHIEWHNKEDQDKANGENRAYLFALRIEPDKQKQGLGTKLVEEAIKLIKQKGFTEATIGAYKDESNLKALYQKWGFIEYIKDVLEENDEYSKYYELYLRKLS